jgi:hypothetical protein
MDIWGMLKVHTCWAWWYRTVIPTLGGLRQEGGELEASLGYIARPCFKTALSKPKTQSIAGPFCPWGCHWVLLLEVELDLDDSSPTTDEYERRRRAWGSGITGDQCHGGQLWPCGMVGANADSAVFSPPSLKKGKK